MDKIQAVLLLTCVFGFVNLVVSQAKMEQSDDGTSGKLSFSTPDLNDEEAHSQFMPEQLKCDGCTVVALKLFEKFSDWTSKRPSAKGKISESDLLEVTEAVCQQSSVFDSYGVKEVRKVKRLSGPGLPAGDEPGIMAGGGKWPGRLMEMCDDFMAEIGEDVIWKNFYNHPKSQKKFQKYLCMGEGLLGHCKKVQKKDEL